jgi:hypothetical protein
MTYKINKTDGSLLVEIIDSQVDRTSTDLTLIGKNVTSYGEYINENFVKLLENFSSTSEPSNPITGQIWFDLTDNRLKVYDGNGFRIGSGPTLAGTAPLNPNQGEFWIDTKEKQLWFYDSALNRYPASKIWTQTQGKSGFEIATISDTFENQKTITKLYNGGSNDAANLLAIFSHHQEFTPKSAINGFTTIKPGINITSNISGFKLHGTATKADALVDALGVLKTAEDFLVTNVDSTLIGNVDAPNSPALTIVKKIPLLLGTSGELSIEVGDYNIAESNTGNTNRAIFRSNYEDQDFIISTKPGGTNVAAFVINGATNCIGIFNDDPEEALDVTGNVKISGNLTVNGATTTINSTTLTVDDINIILGETASPTNLTATGGGITLRGTTNKTILWDNTNSNWTSSEHWNLVSSKSYKINNVEVLTSNSLGSAITSAPGLTSIGTLSTLTVGNTVITSGTISTSTGQLVINPAGTNSIFVSNSKITGLADPDPSVDTDAANVKFVKANTPNAWVEVSVVDSPYQTANNERLFIKTVGGSVTVVLPTTPGTGHTIRFLDYDSTFDEVGKSLKIVRPRTYDDSIPGSLSGDSLGAVLGTYTGIISTNVIGVGTGLTLDIITSSNGTYSSSNTSITFVDQGVGYKDGDVIKVLGTDLGGTTPANDLLITLSLDLILNADDDIEVTTADSAFGLMFDGNSWRYVDTIQLPSLITADIVGDLTGNVTGNLTGNVTGNVNGALTGNVTGNVSGNVTGNLTGTVLTAAQTSITSLGTLTGLTVSSAINADLAGNVTGNVFGDSVTATNDLTLESGADNVKIISGANGLRLSAYDNSGTQEQYILSVTSATASGNRSSTLLFGDVIVANQTGANTNGSSFRLPTYTNAQIAARTLSFLNYGEIIYNSDTGKMQAYVNPGAWVDLH